MVCALGVQRLHLDGAVRSEREDDDHDHRSHIDDKQHIGVNMRQYVGKGIVDLLLDQLGLGLGDGQIVPLLS